VTQAFLPVLPAPRRMISPEIMRRFHAESRHFRMENVEIPRRQNLLHFAHNALRQKLPRSAGYFVKFKDFFQISSSGPNANN
jgi:hypothetical protein